MMGNISNIHIYARCHHRFINQWSETGFTRGFYEFTSGSLKRVPKQMWRIRPQEERPLPMTTGTHKEGEMHNKKVRIVMGAGNSNIPTRWCPSSLAKLVYHSKN